MSTAEQNAAEIIRSLKIHFGVTSDDALAERLGVAKSTVATWRRREAVPARAMEQIERDLGLTVDTIKDVRKQELRDYVLRQVFFHLIISVTKALVTEDVEKASLTNLADDFALIEPYLKRSIIRASASDKYRGVSGSVSFLMAVRSEEIDAGDLWAEAKADRKRDLDAHSGL